ncbi:MAG TPA: ATP-binding protein [Gammaproteobacteria bacterium]|nr:ATP-binding protein [Gammaproteobacteria bacterium]
MRSINARMLVAASLVLVLFFTLSGGVLDYVFRRTAEETLRHNLQLTAYGLMSAANVDPVGDLRMPSTMPNPRLSRRASGLYGQIRFPGGPVLWRSPSAKGIRIPYPKHVPSGGERTARVEDSRGKALYTLSYSVVWQTRSGDQIPFIFDVAESLGPYDRQLAQFRTNLFTGFAVLTGLLLAIQAIVLRLGLRPLRRIESDLAAMEAGRHTELTGRYPRELARLADNLNALVRSQHAHLERYRHSLEDLAHSLKTPLAVMTSHCNEEAMPPELGSRLREQINRLQQIVDYQLQRAAASGTRAGGKAVDVAACAERIRSTLGKVYRDRGLDITLAVPEGLTFLGEEGDLLEVLGNLGDNACKWARGRVRITAGRSGGTGGGRVRVSVEDDGPGIPERHADRLLRRGVRGDQSVQGQGIGLAVVGDIVVMYGGEVSVERSPDLGGARVSVTLPGAGIEDGGEKRKKNR